MAVVQANIKSALIAMSDKLKTQEDQDKAIDDWAEELSGIIKDAILSADVTGVSTSVSTTVATVGTPTAQTGTGVGTGTQSNLGSLQ